MFIAKRINSLSLPKMYNTIEMNNNLNLMNKDIFDFVRNNFYGVISAYPATKE